MSISLVSIHASMKSPSEGGGDESQQTLNISVFYTLMKEVFGLDAQEQGCPVPVARILMEVNQPKNSPQWTLNF